MLVVSLLAVSAAAQGSDGAYGCEANPTGNPIGGGEGYSDIFTSGDFTVTTAEELLDALKQAEHGQVIFLPDGVEIDLTGHLSIGVPGGVIVAGTRGLHGSPGARVFTTQENVTQFITSADEVRFTGLRFEGPYSGSERSGKFWGLFLSTRHYGTEVDNCEIYNWNYMAISISLGASRVQVHHNYIHHSQRGGYGYGVCIAAADADIIANKFDYCRHHVAGDGAPGCSYEAAWNLIMPNCTGYCLDMHGGGDRGDGTDIAGDWIYIHHNTFQGKQRAVGIYGVPSEEGQIHHNWFTEPSAEAVHAVGNTRVYDNVYGPDKTLQEEPIEF